MNERFAPVVAIPVQDEAERIVACLDALAAQRDGCESTNAAPQLRGRAVAQQLHGRHRRWYERLQAGCLFVSR